MALQLHDNLQYLVIKPTICSIGILGANNKACSTRAIVTHTGHLAWQEKQHLASMVCHLPRVAARAPMPEEGTVKLYEVIENGIAEEF